MVIATMKMPYKTERYNALAEQMIYHFKYILCYKRDMITHS